MATYTNLNIPKLATAALQQFVKELAPFNVFSTSFSGEEVNTKTRGNVVKVPLVGTLTATTYGGTYAVCGGSKTVVTVTINRHKVVHIGQHDLDALDNSDSALESFGFQQGRALAQAFIEDVLTLVTTANFTSVSAVTSSVFSIPEIRAARLALNIANAPKLMRAGLIDCTPYDALLSIPNLLQVNTSGSTESLREGRVSRAFGMDLYELNSVFVSAASINAFFCSPEAIAIAMRYVAPQNPGAYDNAGSYTDPVSGATVGLRDVYDPLTATRYMALECNYGYSVGISNGGRIVKRLD